jgi:hypothetical protein
MELVAAYRQSVAKGQAANIHTIAPVATKHS